MDPDPEAETALLKEVSADLPFELQSKLFDQLAAMGVAGAGLVITLAGSLLQGHKLIWMAAIEFALAAIVALTGQVHMIDALFRKAPAQRRSKLLTMITIVLIGMGIGSLATSVFLEGNAPAAPVTR